MSIFGGVCQIDGCKNSQYAEVERPKGAEVSESLPKTPGAKFVCRDCATEMKALYDWTILRLQP